METSLPGIKEKITPVRNSEKIIIRLLFLLSQKDLKNWLRIFFKRVIYAFPSMIRSIWVVSMCTYLRIEKIQKIRLHEFAQGPIFFSMNKK